MSGSNTAKRDRPGEWPYRELIEYATDLIAVLDATGTVRYASPSHESVLGYRPAELIGRNAFDLVHPDDCAALLATFGEGIARGQVTDTGEFRYRAADGGWRVLDGVGRNLLDHAVIAGVVVTSRDVTARRRDEEELRQHRQQLAERLAELELLYDTAPVGLAMVDTELRFVRINDRLAVINGRPAAAHIGVPVRDVIPNLAPQIEPLYRRVIETGEPVLNFEVHGVTPADPAERDWLVSHYPVVDRDGRVFGVNAVVQDITESKQAHRTLEHRVEERTAELQASEQTYRALVETLRDVVFTLDEQGVITYISPAIEPLSGLLPGDVIGRRFDEFIHPGDVAAVLASFQRSVAGAIEPLEFRVLRKSGEEFWVRTLSRIVHRPDGAAELRGVMTDVTARRQAEDLVRRQQAELAHAQRVATIGEMTAEVAHEINQPLAAIVNFADGLALRLREPVIDRDAMLSVAGQIAAEGRRAAEVIRRLRDFVRKGAILAEPSDINRLVREVAALLDAETRRHGVAIRLRLDEGLGAVLLDRIQIQQVIMNLLRNGLDAIVGGDDAVRLLTVETRAAGARGILLVVHDSGVGLPPGAADQIFDAFFTTKPDGLGIGLTISRSIAEAHGGELWAERHPERGAIFYLSLPGRS
jgi:PAS domain S-box-containing protein